MIKREEIIENFNRSKKRIEWALEKIEEGDIDEAVNQLFLAGENLISTVKFQLNSSFTDKHFEKIIEARRFFIMEIFSKDYTEVLKKLKLSRIPAIHHPYTSISKKYSRKEVEKWLGELKEMLKDVENFMKKRGFLDDK